MNEYIFFDEALRDQFLSFLHQRGIDATTEPDRITGHVVRLADDIDDDLGDVIDEHYDALMDTQQELIEAEDADEHTTMGVDITLPDGQPCVVRIPSELGRRLCQHFSGEEIRTLATAIAADAVAPSSTPICCRA